MPRGVNVANATNTSGRRNGELCIFLSHRSTDKPTVRIIADYIAKAGLDYYLDENDYDLQEADRENNHERVVACIQKGIKESTHVLCCISPDALSSIWMPYEIGYADEKANKKTACLKLKTTDLARIPSFYKIRNFLPGLKSFNAFLQEVSGPYGNVMKRWLDKDYLQIVDVNEYESKESEVLLGEYAEKHPLFDTIDE